MAEATTPIDFEVWCSYCGEGLCGGTKIELARRGVISIKVKPCLKCLERAEEKGCEQGYEEGYKQCQSDYSKRRTTAEWLGRISELKAELERLGCKVTATVQVSDGYEALKKEESQ